MVPRAIGPDPLLSGRQPVVPPCLAQIVSYTCFVMLGGMLMEVLYQSSTRTPGRSQMLTGRSTRSVSTPLWSSLISSNTSRVRVCFLPPCFVYCTSPQSQDLIYPPHITPLCRDRRAEIMTFLLFLIAMHNPRPMNEAKVFNYYIY